MSKTLKNLKILTTSIINENGQTEIDINIYQNKIITGNITVMCLKRGLHLDYSTAISDSIYQCIPVTIKFPKSNRSRNLISWELNFDPTNDEQALYVVASNQITIYNIQKDSKKQNIFSIAIMVDPKIKSENWKDLLNGFNDDYKRNLDSNGSYFYNRLNKLGKDIDILPYKTILIHGVKVKHDQKSDPYLKFINDKLNVSKSRYNEYIDLVKMKSPILNLISSEVISQLDKYLSNTLF